MQESPLHELPSELVWLIGGLLSRRDLQSVRLVCHDLYEKTFDSFASRFLRSISTNLTASSLSQVNALCKRRRACENVQHLSFLARGTTDLTGPSWSRDLFWDPDRNSPLDAAPVRTLRDNLLYNLVNCRSFSIRYYQHSYRMYPTDLPFGECIAVFLAIIADAGIPVTSFQFLGPDGYMTDADDLHHVLSPWPESSVIWGHLQDLCLHWPANNSYMRTCLHSPFLLSAVQCAPRLHKLYIDFYGAEASAFVRKLGATEHLPQIQDLTLKHGRIEEQYIQTFLQRLQKSLRALSLHNICLGHHGGGSLIRAAFVDDAPNLRSISVSNIRDHTADQSHLFYDFPAFLQVSFAQSALRQQCRLTGSHIHGTYSIGVPCVLGVQYSGPFMREIQSKIRTGRTVRIIDVHKLDDESLGGSRVSAIET
jgi:hypothetical protein